ncbi:MAG: PepSY domain-containing protein [Gammaproteobacteria bacterium]|nr:PepSY domain-containing protein [Gammaproteobacteria bacterium]
MSVARLHRWHRAVGLFVALLIAMLTTTGLALTYTEALGLDKHFITTPSLLNWYAIRPPPLPLAYQVGPHWISQVGTHLYFDQTLFPARATSLHGACLTREVIVAAVDQELWFLTHGGEVIERLPIAEPIESLGLSADGTPVVRARNRSFSIDVESGDIGVAESGKITWAEPTSLPLALAQALTALYRGRELTLERVVFDLHTGRIFGFIGVTLVSLSALGMLFLAGSGAVTWWRRWQRLHRRHHH